MHMLSFVVSPQVGSDACINVAASAGHVSSRVQTVNKIRERKKDVLGSAETGQPEDCPQEPEEKTVSH